MATIDGKKTGGRKKGAVNLRTKVGAKAHDIAARLEIDPFEILLRFAANDWEGLGYTHSVRTIYVSEDCSYEVDIIQANERIAAAKAACEYLLPKRKSVELSGPEGKDLFQSFADLAKQVVDAK